MSQKYLDRIVLVFGTFEIYLTENKENAWKTVRHFWGVPKSQNSTEFCNFRARKFRSTTPHHTSTPENLATESTLGPNTHFPI